MRKSHDASFGNINNYLADAARENVREDFDFEKSKNNYELVGIICGSLDMTFEAWQKIKPAH